MWIAPRRDPLRLPHLEDTKTSKTQRPRTRADHKDPDMKTFIACFGTETNSFASMPTGMHTFEETML
ncbi:MAG: hypothetical protein AAGJ28_24025, partial [Pseudomonadota bacterium]